MADTNYCSECGAELADNVKFCSSCGTGAEQGSVEAEAATPPPVAAAQATTSPPPPPPVAAAQASTPPPPVAAAEDSTPREASPDGGQPIATSVLPAGDNKRTMWMIGGGVAVAVVIGIVVVMTSQGGNKRSQRRAATAAPAADTRGVVVVSEASPQEVSPVEEPAAPESVEDLMLSVDGVSDLSLHYAPRHIRLRAIKLNGRAVKTHIKKNYDEAIGYYTTALELWPGYILARFNLACAFALTGDKERSLGLLKQLKLEGCVKCLERVQRARSDTDFQTLWSDGDFQVLTGGIHVMLPNYEALTKKLIRELGKGYFGLLVGAANRGVTIDINGTDITAKDQLVRYKINLMKNFARDFGDAVNWRSYKPQFHPGQVYGYRLKCKGDCCDIYIPRDERDSSLGEGVIGTLSRACFWPTSETEAFPRLLKFAH